MATDDVHAIEVRMPPSRPKAARDQRGVVCLRKTHLPHTDWANYGASCAGYGKECESAISLHLQMRSVWLSIPAALLGRWQAV
jgi:hypothetical protein